MEKISEPTVENAEKMKEAIYIGCSGDAVDFFVVDGAIWEIEKSSPDQVLRACECCMSWSIKDYFEKNKLRMPDSDEKAPDIEILNRSRRKAEGIELEKKMSEEIVSLMNKRRFSDAEVMAKILKFEISYDENKALILISKNSEVLNTFSVK